ncbi:hypothetical protein [Bacillus sp. FJAT-27445]|uniref:hypothetical protein n=1 Tax=Bacillus sp. FJAT-27445 TaxID=1679166 RepID=UPI0007439CA5|nr:hypothetical protein [Bacillus sp. FJAT-27445]
MQLSRMELYKNKNSTVYKNRKAFKTNTLKIALLIPCLGITIVTSTSIAFADSGLKEYLTSWYLNKLVNIEESLTNSVITEANNQKAILLQKVREQTLSSIEDLQTYAKEKETLINDNIKKKADEVTKALENQNNIDLELRKNQIDKQTEEMLDGSKNEVNPSDIEAEETVEAENQLKDPKAKIETNVN